MRIRSETPPDDPIRANPTITGTACSVAVPSAVSAQPVAPSKNPTTITGTRPNLSIDQPAGKAVRADAVRKIAGPSPRSASNPVTRTNVSDETAATSWSTAELTAMIAPSRIVLRRIGRSAAAPSAPIGR
ncbi:MAG TPA: hypothetical protein VKA24_02915 [Gaiellaceae bacterium]|nr:hypothetical protein [Gaiellaceae bacterium]